MVFGSQIVLIIAPAATAFALMVGITLGLPAGYYGGRIDSFLSFLANLVLAFPVILLFYLLVTPGIMGDALPYAWRACSSLSIIFFLTLFYTRFKNRPDRRSTSSWGSPIVIGGWIYVGLVFDRDPLGIVSIDPNQLNIFVAVVFASSPGVFRIVRGLVMDIKTRDYVAAAQTRGETPWYIMLWEICPTRAVRSLSTPACASAIRRSCSARSAISASASRPRARTGARPSRMPAASCAPSSTRPCRRRSR